MTKFCVHCGRAFKVRSIHHRYCSRACWTDMYEKSEKKKTPEYKAIHKAATYRWRKKVKARKLEERERNRERISNAFKRGLRQDRYGRF